MAYFERSDIEPRMPTRLFHISDVHFGVEDRAALIAVAEAVAREKPDAVVCTGDLTQRAKHSEYAAAQEWFASLGVPVVLECLYVALPEPEIAAALDEAAADFPDVALGSYPHFKRGLDYSVKLTAEHVDGARVRALVDQLERTLPPGCIVRRERG
jgi:3',5'-cyclic AMP phosphodiesterase CpdA